jgi:hypothetical protein
MVPLRRLRWGLWPPGSQSNGLAPASLPRLPALSGSATKGVNRIFESVFDLYLAKFDFPEI